MVYKHAVDKSTNLIYKLKIFNALETFVTLT